jgi:CRISPR/Cas system-associated protein Cas5 (RAMP superfamily)
VVLLPSRDEQVTLPVPPAATVDGMLAYELKRYGVVA